MILELKITDIVKFPNSRMSAESIHIVNILATNENENLLNFMKQMLF